jgi:hypothetical protein
MQVAICDADKICCKNLIKWLKEYIEREKIINVEKYYSAESLLNRWQHLTMMKRKVQRLFLKTLKHHVIQFQRMPALRVQ